MAIPIWNDTTSALRTNHIFYHIAATRPESHEDSAAWLLCLRVIWSVTESGGVLKRLAAG